MEFPTASTHVPVPLVRSSSFVLVKLSWREVLFLIVLPKVELSLSLRLLSDTGNFGRNIRSPDALRPLTLCNCDCKLLTSVICRGLHWYTMRCFHPSQRSLSSRHMTDNIFEIETTALAHVACGPQESGVLLTDFAAAYTSVNHAWIFSVIEKTELPDFISRFLQSIHNDIITHVEFAGATRGHFVMDRGVRQGCPASVFFFFAMAFL